MNGQLSVTMELQWLASFPASCLHAAEAVAHGRLVSDTLMAEAIAEPAQVLRQTIVAAGLPRTAFWRNLTGFAVAAEGTTQLAERAVTKTVGASCTTGVVAEIAAAISGLQSAVRRTLPTMVDDLSPRVGGLRSRWETQGPKILQGIARWTAPRVIAEQAHVVVVHPALGGGGSAHLPYNNVLIEAVTPDPVAELPEMLRLAWLLSQLNLDLPMFSERIHGKRLPHIAELAMIPVALKAAEELEMLHLSPESVDLALNSWHVVTPPDIDPVDIVWRWWDTYRVTRPQWDVAFVALDRMLE